MAALRDHPLRRLLGGREGWNRPGGQPSRLVDRIRRLARADLRDGWAARRHAPEQEAHAGGERRRSPHALHDRSSFHAGDPSRITPATRLGRMSPAPRRPAQIQSRPGPTTSHSSGSPIGGSGRDALEAWLVGTGAAGRESRVTARRGRRSTPRESREPRGVVYRRLARALRSACRSARRCPRGACAASRARGSTTAGCCPPSSGTGTPSADSRRRTSARRRRARSSRG